MLVCLIIVCRVVSIFILVVIASFMVMPGFKLVGLMIYQRPPRGVLQIRPKDVITHAIDAFSELQCTFKELTLVVVGKISATTQCRITPTKIVTRFK